MNTETKIDLTPSNLVTIITETGLEINSSTSQLIKEKFEPFIADMEQWKKKAEGLVVVDATEKAKMRDAREARLALRAVRVEADKVRKALKEDSNRYNKAVQGIYNFIEGKIIPLEEHLEQQEKFAEIQEKKEREALKGERVRLVSQYSNDAELFNLGELSQESFDSLYGTLKQAHEAKILAEQKAKEEAEAKAKLEAEEKERQRVEIERLKAEAKEREEKEKAVQLVRNERNMLLRTVNYIHDTDIVLLSDDDFEQLFQDKKVIFNEQEKRKELMKVEALAEANRIKAAAQKALDEEKKKNEALQAERDKVQAELKAKQDAENAAKKAEEEKIKLQEQEKNKENLATDKQKMLMFAKELMEIKFPTLKRADSQKIIDNSRTLINKVVAYIHDNTKNLK